MKSQSVSSQNNGNSPTALVLGGAGSVGSYLCDSLLSQNCRVVCLDRFTALKENNIAHLVGNRNFKIIREGVEITDRVDYVFCLAKRWRILLEKFPESRWLFLLPDFSNDIFDQAQELGVNFRFACHSGFFGPRLDLNQPMWTAKIIKDIFFRRRVRLAGDGSSLVYPLFTRDLVSGLTASLFMPQSCGQVFYFSGEEITLFSFVKLWSDHFSDLKIDFGDEREPPSAVSQGETLLSKRELGWKINYSYREAVSLTVDWLNRPDVGRVLSDRLTERKKAATAGKSSYENLADFRDRDKEEIAFNLKGSSLEPRMSKLPPSKFNLGRKKGQESGVTNEGLWLSREPGREESDKPSFDIREMEINGLLAEAEKKEGYNLKEGRSSFLEKPRRKIKWLVALVSLLILISPWVFLGKDLALGANYLNQGQETCSAGQLDSCQKQAKLAWEYFYRARNTVEKLAPALTFFLGQDNFGQVSRGITLAQEAAEALVYSSNSARKLGQVFQAVILNREADFGHLLSEAGHFSQGAYFKLTNITATGDDFRLPLADKFLEKVPAALEGTKTMLDLLPLLADFLAKEDQTIIFLLQNNMEIRPTGGFIGSLGVARFEFGRLTDFTVSDIYEFDGQLKGQVEPPEDLKKYLGEESWYLRDANWSPDFPKTAQQVIWFWQKQLNREADGVIAINLQAAEKLLAALDSVYLPDYQEEITALNLFERAEYHSEVGFFPGSTQKKDFLGSLAFEILEKIKRQENLSLSLLRACQESLLESEIMVYFSDSSMEEKVMSLGFDGGVKNAVCQKENCLVDYLWSVDTNVGANKANFFLKKRIIQRLGISDDRINHSLRIVWENTAQTQSWPAGTYKNYWRLYVPSSAILQEAFWENNAGQREAINLVTDQEMGKTVWSYLIEVPINSQVILEINYQIENKFLADRKRLVFLVQKQAGASWEEDVMLVSYPTEWLPLVVSPEGEISQGAVTYRNILSQDRLFEFEWGKP
jgi:nucleoside-diphosphate-sugar epimerase